MFALSGKPRILVVEDSWLLADMVCGMLQDCGADPIGPFSTVERALQSIQEQELDAALLDIMVRGGSTFSAWCALRTLNVPFIFLTGAKRAALPAEFHDVLIVAKPFEWPLLEGAIQGMLNGGERRP